VTVSTFWLRGEIEAANASAFRDKLAAFVAGCSDDDEILFDCSNLEFIDSRGLAVMLDEAFDLERRGFAFKLVNPSDHFAGVLRIAQLAEALHLDQQKV
jgi:anti-anti-sigma factor